MWSSIRNLGLFIFGPIVLLFAGVYGFLLSYPSSRRDQKKIRAIRQRGGFLPWKDVVGKLHEQECTFILQSAHPRGNLVWWTHVDILSMFQNEHEQKVSPLEGWANADFRVWIREKLEASPTFPVYLTDPPAEFPAWEPHSIRQYIMEKSPKAKVIVVNLSGITICPREAVEKDDIRQMQDKKRN